MENISIDLLIPHPKNPRQDVGDISELIYSIKENGIMQNLTVVPLKDGTYHVVIGNRRLAAAKVAGLSNLPCSVVDLDEKSQQSMMLLENMQRVDLTPYEQAEGFQMCIDLGMTEDDLKKKTGFSTKTIKHRLKLLELDKKMFKKGNDRGATIQDYIDLEQIENIEKKNELLATIGTNDYRYKLNNELNQQKKKKDREAFILNISGYIDKVDNLPKGFELFMHFYSTNEYKNFKVPEDIDKRKYVFRVYCGSTIEIWREKLESEKSKKDNQEENSGPTKEQLAIENIKEKVAVAYQTRLQFAKETYRDFDLSVDATKKTELYYALRFFFDDSLGDFGWDNKNSIFAEVTGKSIEDININEINSSTASYRMMYKYLFAIMYANLENDKNSITVNTWEYGNRYGMYTDSNDDEIKELYTFLEAHGYQPSKEEEDIMFGTNELYVKNKIEGE